MKEISCLALVLTLSACKPYKRFEASENREHFDAMQKSSLRFAEEGREAMHWFEEMPISQNGIPALMFRLFPEIAPEIWGTTVEDLSAFGLPRRPLKSGTYAGQAHPFALGLGVHPSAALQGMHVVGLTCGACHTGRVRLGDGSVLYLMGGSSQQFDARKYQEALQKTMNHPQFTADVFRELVRKKSKTDPWLYNKRETVGIQYREVEAFLNAKDATGALLSDQIVQQVKALYPPRTLPEGNVGQADLVSGMLLAIGAKPLAAAVVDFPVVWKQETREFALHDGTSDDPFYRSVAAAVGAAGSPDVNLVNAMISSRMLKTLAAPAYPFPVDEAAVGRGSSLYQKHCESCHVLPTGKRTVLVPFSKDKGVSEERAKQWEGTAIKGLQAALRKICDTGPFVKIAPWSGKEASLDAAACNIPAEKILQDRSSNPGMAAQSLAGVWSSAPYLHNGSVPNLRMLLIPGLRPKTFVRGNLSFDEANVGYKSDAAESDNPLAFTYDTTKPGRSNVGHSTVDMLGDKDWGTDPAATTDLLEYLKTL